jgi:hypothetical protein
MDKYNGYSKDSLFMADFKKLKTTTIQDYIDSSKISLFSIKFCFGCDIVLAKAYIQRILESQVKIILLRIHFKNIASYP